jgi:hypothetical protein
VAVGAVGARLGDGQSPEAQAEMVPHRGDGRGLPRARAPRRRSTGRGCAGGSSIAPVATVADIAGGSTARVSRLLPDDRRRDARAARRASRSLRRLSATPLAGPAAATGAGEHNEAVYGGLAGLEVAALGREGITDACPSIRASARGREGARLLVGRRRPESPSSISPITARP